MADKKYSIPSEAARHEGNRLSFWHFADGARERPLLARDVWGLLIGELSRQMPKRRTSRYAEIEEVLYYVRLAEGFYQAAHRSDLPTSALLWYYGMLNLVKALHVKHEGPISKIEHHGLRLERSSQSVGIDGEKNSKFQVFHALEKQIGNVSSSIGKRSLEIWRLMSYIPEVHATYSAVSAADFRRDVLLPVRIDYCLSDDKSRLHSRILYDEKVKFIADRRNVYKGVVKDLFHKPVRVSKDLIMVSKESKGIRENTDLSRLHRNFLKKQEALPIVSLLSRQGYRYYLDLRPGDFHHLSYSFAAAFYFGSVVRYVPAQAQSILEGRMRAMVSEFFSVAPNQFLYQIAARILSRAVLVPHSAVD